MIKLTDILFEGKLSKSQIKKMRKDFDKTGKLPPHLKKLADLMDKEKKVKDIVIPGLEWMADIKEGKLNEAKIEKDVEMAAKKTGIKFKKIWSNVRTNKFSNPTGDVKKMGKDVENVKMNQWMSDEKSVTKQNYEELGMKLIKLLSSKYVPIKKEKYGDRGGVKFMNRKKDPRSEFWISYDKTIAGPYISYRGLKGV